MRDLMFRLYLRFRSPKIFLIFLSTFIITALVLHYTRGYDSDWGGTNLTLSIEASVASAVLTVAAEETIHLLKEILQFVKEIWSISKRLDQMLVAQEKTLKGVMLIAEAQRDALIALQEKENECRR